MAEGKVYDLEERAFAFAKAVRLYVKGLKPSVTSTEDVRQLVRASGSVGANYIEANGALGKKAFLMRLRICRKEAKECVYWLRLLEVQDHQAGEPTRQTLQQEATELTSIFNAILKKTE